MPRRCMDNRLRVLIDTWWNVNDFDIFRYANLFGFNRYMVECEFPNPLGKEIVDIWF